MTATRSLAAALALGSVLGISCFSEPLPPSTYRYKCNDDGDCPADSPVCMSGRCERPCHPLPFLAAVLVGVDGPCPLANGYAGCYNGACSNSCDLDNDLCPSGRRCADVDLQVSGSNSGAGGGSTETRYGVCIFECTTGDCPLGQKCNADGRCGANDELLCLPSDVAELDFCLQPCTAEAGCPVGFYCEPSFSFCAPECAPECPPGQTCFLGACTPECSDDGSCADGQCCRFDRICSPEDVEFPLPGGECANEETGGSTSDGSTSGGTASDGTASDGTTSGMGADPADEERR